MSGTTMDQIKTSTESKKGQTRTSSGRGGHWERRNYSNNIIDSATSTEKYYKGDIEAFGAVFALKYKKVELKKYFDLFREKPINYTIK